MGKAEADQFNDQGIEKYNEGKYEEAEKLYRKALKEDSSHKWVLHNLGLLYKAMKKYDLALEYYRKSISVDESYADAYNGLGTVYYEKEEYDEAEKNYRRAMELEPDNYFPYYNMGLVHEKRNEPEKAKEAYLKAVKVNPSYAKAHNSLGICFYNEKDYDHAIHHYKKSIENDRNSVYPYYNLGLVYEKKNEFKKAYYWYRQALKINPDYQYAKDGIEYVKKQFGNGIDLSALEQEEEKNEKIDAVSHEENGAEEQKSFLEQFGRNLSQMAKEGKLFEAVGRDAEIDGLLEILYKRIKNNPVLVGHPGVGKTAIVEGLAKRMAEGRVPENFLNKEIVELNVGSLVAGTTFRGQLEEKIKQVMEEVRKNPDLIVFIDEIHTIVGAGRTSEGSLDIGQMLKPALARGEFPCIGATTISEYQKYFEKDEALERRFYPLRIDELSPDATEKVLNYLKPRLEAHYHLELSEENLQTVVELSHRYLKKRYFPDKAIDILEKTCSRAALHGKKKLSSEDIRQIIGENCGIQFMEDAQDEKSRMLKIEEYLKSRVMGQDDVIDRVAGLVRMTKSRLDLKPERPDGVFLFTGPSGVGKTELAKELARFLFGSDKRLIKIDMSEFTESHSISKMIGSPPGYVGYEDRAYLTSQIEENPSSVLLLDEVEKAHPEVLKIFLQVFDEGRLKDSRGRMVSFSDVTIIMTSNIIREFKAKKTLGFGSSEAKESGEPNMQEIVEELSRFFPLEFLNRIDEILLFKPLNENDLKNIVEQKILSRAKEIFARQELEVEFHPSVLEELIHRGYSREFGARNLERAFETLVLRPVSSFLFESLEKKSHLHLSYENGKLQIQS